MLPDDIAGSITSTMQALANALRDNIDAQSLDAVARELQRLRDRLHDDDHCADGQRRTAPSPGPLWQL